MEPYLKDFSTEVAIPLLEDHLHDGDENTRLNTSLSSPVFIYKAGMSTEWCQMSIFVDVTIVVHFGKIVTLKLVL